MITPHSSVRIGDRVQRLVVLFAVLITIAAVPIAAAIGSAVYDSRSREYTELAETSHVVTATVTGIKIAHHESLGPTITVLARWFHAGTEHTGAVPAPPGIKSGDSLDIWVGEDGSHVGPPSVSPYDEAVAVGAAIWCGVAVAAGLLVFGARTALNRARRTGRPAHQPAVSRAGALAAAV